MKTNHYKIEFGFGVGKDKNQRTLSYEDVQIALANIRAEAARVYGAYTLTGTTGGWRNGAGVLVTEGGYSLSIVVPVVRDVIGVGPRELVPPSLADKCFAAYIAGALNQEAVAITVTPVHFELYFP